MSLKILLVSLLILFTCSSSLYASETDSLRKMFQNNEAVIYSLNIRTFNADDKNGNGIIDFSSGETSGSFINAIDRLDELQSLGINTVHLLPITPVGKIKAIGTAGSLYALADFTTLNSQLEDFNSELSLKEQAKTFFDECHKRNIKVIVDLPSCGAYDLFINRPDLFLKDANGVPYIPADWADVRLFDVPHNDKLFKSDIYFLHKIFVNNMLELGADGIRADVATIKPYIFWKELINYTRSKNPDFMFLAEASQDWTQPASDKAYFTDYKKLLEAGFDGYYGNYFNLKNWNGMRDLKNSVRSQQKIFKKYKDKKSVIGSFATHDVVSPLITGGENFSKIIIWLNATLPLNPYYVDGFLQADDYIYNYSNKKAYETYTDDEFYYVHQGQIDIFNFSRKPFSDSDVLRKEHELAMKLRKDFLPQISIGKFIPLSTDNDKIFAYKRTYNNKSVVVVINSNNVSSENVKVKVGNINNKSKINFIKGATNVVLKNRVLMGKFAPSQVVIYTIE